MTGTGTLICWSGGCDSTLLLYHAARLYGTPHNPVRAISITSDQVSSRKRETIARGRILRALKKQGLHVSHTEVHVSTTKGGGLRWHGQPQAVLWLLATQALRETEVLGLGYIKGDDWSTSRHEFTGAFDHLQKAAGRTGTLWTPMLYTEKRGVLYQLQGLKLLDLCWWCGSPPKARGSKPCEKCPSCAAHATGLWKLANHGPGNYWEGEDTE